MALAHSKHFGLLVEPFISGKLVSCTCSLSHASGVGILGHLDV